MVVVTADLEEFLGAIASNGNHWIGEVRRAPSRVSIDLQRDLAEQVLVAIEPGESLFDPGHNFRGRTDGPAHGGVVQDRVWGEDVIEVSERARVDGTRVSSDQVADLKRIADFLKIHAPTLAGF